MEHSIDFYSQKGCMPFYYTHREIERERARDVMIHLMLCKQVIISLVFINRKKRQLTCSVNYNAFPFSYTAHSLAVLSDAENVSYVMDLCYEITTFYIARHPLAEMYSFHTVKWVDFKSLSLCFRHFGTESMVLTNKSIQFNSNMVQVYNVTLFPTMLFFYLSTNCDINIPTIKKKRRRKREREP